MASLGETAGRAKGSKSDRIAGRKILISKAVAAPSVYCTPRHGATVSHPYRANANAGARARTHFARWALALVLAALSIAASAAAQEAPAAEEPASAPEDLAIPLGEISRRAERTTLILNRTAATFHQTPDVAEIEEQIPEIEESLKKRRRLLARNLESGGLRGRF